MKMQDYLGDGLYVEFDGWQYKLYASNGVRITNEVYLDESVLAAFFDFVKRSKEQRDDT
jgi:hypothetical protein